MSSFSSSQINPQVSIITVNYNGLEDTMKLLESVAKCDYDNLEVIVVDNASMEDPTVPIKNKFQEVSILRSEENLGFAGGNNLGLKKANGALVFFINNDTVVEVNAITILVKAILSDKTIGGVSPKIKYFEHPDLIQFAGFTPINRITGRNKTLGEREIDQGQYDDTKLMPYLHGAAMLVKREVIEAIGEMYEDYFLYYEEVDWSERMTSAGYKLLYVPSATIYHKESASVKRVSHLKLYYQTRNRFLFIKRNYSRIDHLLFCLYFILIAFPLKSLRCFVNKDIRSIKVMINGMNDYIKHLRKV